MDIKELEERLKKLEDRNKENFFQIENRFTSIESMLAAKPITEGGERAVAEGEEKITNFNELNERIQELEDLLLLIEMENTKIKEKILGSANTETPMEVLNRVQKLEEDVAAIRNLDTEALEKKIADLEERLDRAETPERRAERPRAKAVKEYDDESDIYEAVQKILQG